MSRATWLADELRRGGLHVVEVGGWSNRTRPVSSGPFEPKAVIVHHDASKARHDESDWMPSWLARTGRPDLPPPLCHLWIAMNGTVYVVAAGRANHAGPGKGWGVIGKNLGNRHAIGIETDHTTGERWPAEQYDALVRTTAVLVRKLGASPKKAVCGHKEYAPGLKVDPDLDMKRFRADVAVAVSAAKRMSSPPRNGPVAFPLKTLPRKHYFGWKHAHRSLGGRVHDGSASPADKAAVARIQTWAGGLNIDGSFGPATHARVVDLQHRWFTKKSATGLVGGGVDGKHGTWAKLRSRG